MIDNRLYKHPILPVEDKPLFTFYFKDRELKAREGETIASALFANGIRIFSYHHKDGAPQGIFCANGQCAQCLVLADGFPVKSCMELIKPGMKIEPVVGLPELPRVDPSTPLDFKPVEEIEVSVLIIGGGPAGLSAAIELGQRGVDCLLVDDKHRLGGKLVLQTHRFFGSVEAVYAGTRGIDIATRLENELRQYPRVTIWLQSTALAVFSDKKVGILKENKQYALVKPKILLVAAGAREKSLAFPGNDLPGVYGAGAFQTLVNRDLVKPTEKLFIVGGGNVGLIAGYHALQAGIKVVALVEVMPEVGGYKVHKDKLARLGVPILTSHTILSANGKDCVESVTIARVDEKFRPVPGTERTLKCDTVLIAVGLDPVNEFYLKAREFDLPVYAAGDAEEIAEASAAIFSGKIRGLEIARELGVYGDEVPADWYRTADILKSRPGQTYPEYFLEKEEGVFPVIHCLQEIPCDPCSAVCPRKLIEVDRSDVRKLPVYYEEKDGKGCSGCERCVVFCPGLAITLVDYRRNPEFPEVTIPFEFLKEIINPGDEVSLVDVSGQELARSRVTSVKSIKGNDRTILVKVQVPKAVAKKVSGIKLQPEITEVEEKYLGRIPDEAIICRCERVTAGEIRKLIREGIRDISEIKTITRAGMGPCGAKTCTPLVHRLFREEGVPESEIVDQPKRPLFIEVPLGLFAGLERKGVRE
ncbi:MAG: FAD-dependent oxidoreductase [Candidatus Saccharicenans sp.]|nr:FAD-dependent oxidoreductase [Candidatus Saccharicenans sp.]MDH7575761.1 FAD-dependent oxidoreductase [Candidatus Saccharicenans sp.]